MINNLELTSNEAGELATAFLTEDLSIAPVDQEWFTVLSSKPMGESWYVVEIGIEGLPDKWVVQVYDTRECDPSYTFVSPVSAEDDHTDLAELPDEIATVLITERDARVA
ncbi:hypothetical protein [Leptolyngbya sp. AN10]|uniref:hypothetical protein n=1 Tax=Leptolyngbya sp. AN10 TaxID=3423365 RepID=UPI003D314A71